MSKKRGQCPHPDESQNDHDPELRSHDVEIVLEVEESDGEEALGARI